MTTTHTHFLGCLAALPYSARRGRIERAKGHKRCHQSRTLGASAVSLRLDSRKPNQILCKLLHRSIKCNHSPRRGAPMSMRRTVWPTLADDPRSGRKSRTPFDPMISPTRPRFKLNLVQLVPTWAALLRPAMKDWLRGRSGQEGRTNDSSGECSRARERAVQGLATRRTII